MEQFICPACKAYISANTKICPSCKVVIALAQEAQEKPRRPKHYPALETVASVFEGLAWFSLLIFAIGVVLGTATIFIHGGRDFINAVFWTIGSFMSFLMLYAASGVIKLAITVEDNVNRIVELLEKTSK